MKAEFIEKKGLSIDQYLNMPYNKQAALDKEFEKYLETHANDAQPVGGQKVEEYGPWKIVISADEKEFVLYKNGSRVGKFDSYSDAVAKTKDGESWKVSYKKNGSNENAIFDDQESAQKFVEKIKGEGATEVSISGSGTKDALSKSDLAEEIKAVKEDIAECKKEGRFYQDLVQELKELEEEYNQTADGGVGSGKKGHVTPSEHPLAQRTGRLSLVEYKGAMNKLRSTLQTANPQKKALIKKQMESLNIKFNTQR